MDILSTWRPLGGFARLTARIMMVSESCQLVGQRLWEPEIAHMLAGGVIERRIESTLSLTLTSGPGSAKRDGTTDHRRDLRVRRTRW